MRSPKRVFSAVSVTGIAAVALAAAPAAFAGPSPQTKAIDQLAAAGYPGAQTAARSAGSQEAARVSTKQKGLFDSFTLKGSHGYKITVGGEATGGVGNSSVQITASDKHGSATYFSDVNKSATVKTNKLAGDFDQFGKISVKFHAKKTKKYRQKGCTGKKAKRKSGKFTGTIKFKGEGGYTSASTHKAKGTVVKSNWKCKIKQRKSTVLDATAPVPSGGFLSPYQFDAVKPDSSSKASFSASSTADYHIIDASDYPVGILRSAYASGPASAFSYPQSLGSAHVAPSSPFSGTADFGAPSSWTGSLKVKFPGTGAVGLTGGSGWRVSLDHENW